MEKLVTTDCVSLSMDRRLAMIGDDCNRSSSVSWWLLLLASCDDDAGGTMNCTVFVVADVWWLGSIKVAGGVGSSF